MSNHRDSDENPSGIPCPLQCDASDDPAGLPVLGNSSGGVCAWIFPPFSAFLLQDVGLENRTLKGEFAAEERRMWEKSR